MLAEFFIWHFKKSLKGYFWIWGNYLAFIRHYFSVNLFLRTLFSPWKRDVSKIGQRGFHPILSLEANLVNLITRILGAILRFAMIICGLLLESFVFIAGLVFLVNWIIAPAIFFWSVYSFFTGGFYAAGLLLTLLIFILSFAAFEMQHRNYFDMDITELAAFPWFCRVINRFGKESKTFDKSIFRDSKKLGKFLDEIGLKKEELARVLTIEIENRLEREQENAFWREANLLGKVPIGKHWAYAYTPNLDRYSKDLTAWDLPKSQVRIFGLESSAKELNLILKRSSQGNAIIIGDAGVGKNSLVYHLANLIRTNSISKSLKNKRILELDLKDALSGCKNPGEIDRMLNILFREAAYAGNVILYIKNVHEFLKSEPSDSREDISSILAQYMSFPTFQIIGTADLPGFHMDVEKKENVMKFCEKLLIPEMGEENTLRVLVSKLETAEKEKIIFTYPALREIIKMAGKYTNDSPYPEKALDLMEEVLLSKDSRSGNFITAEDVDKVISVKLGINLGEVSVPESEKLLNLEKTLHKRVIGQNFAIMQIAQAMRRARIGMADKNKPIGSFLFLGPTGVGKTESAKALAEAYFGDERKIIRLDMSEYQNENSLDRIIGSVSSRPSYLAEKIKEKSFGLLLLDEIEKAHPDILNLFLQVLDEGFFTAVSGKRINFKNYIIIATSNACAELISESVKKGLEASVIAKQVIDASIKEGIFRPEFLNRFEGVIFFEPLKPENIRLITRMMLDKYAKRLKDEKNIEVKFEFDLADAVSQRAYNTMFGARAINRFIEDQIGDKIVKKIIAKEVEEGKPFNFKLAEID